MPAQATYRRSLSNLSLSFSCIPLVPLNDPIRAILEAKAACLAHKVTDANVLVAIGVIFELPELFVFARRLIKSAIRHFRDKRELRELNKIVGVDLSGTVLPKEPPSEHDSTWIKLFAHIGLILVVVGLVGEWRFGEKLNDANNAVHKYDVGRIEEADSKAGDAATSAGTAQNEARSAGDAAKSANREAKEAGADAQTAKRDAEEISAALKMEERQIEIESLFRQSGRLLRPVQLDLLRKTGPLGGGNVDIKYALEREQGPEYFARAISATLKDAGWKVPDELFRWPGDTPAPGVTIHNKWISLPELNLPIKTIGGGKQYLELQLPMSLLLGPAQAKGLSNDEARRLAILWIGLGASLEKDDNMQGYDFRIVVGPEKPAADPAINKQVSK